MKIVDLPQLKDIPVSMTLGSFDGLHRGHSELLERLKQVSSSSGSGSLLMTFHPHPRQVIDTDFNLKLLNTKEEKIEKLKEHAPDYLHFINFTKEFSEMSFSCFYEQYILANLNLKSIVAGSNHVFGKGRMGGSNFLSEFCRHHSIDLQVVGPVNYLDKNISSTRIRNSISAGEIEDANSMLGYNYSFKGEVVRGSGTGTKIGFPTANLSLKNVEKVIPGKGVYLVSVCVSGRKFFGLSNIGNKPTFGNFEPAIETNIFGFEGDLYGKEINIFFIKKLRDEIKFGSAEELGSAISHDRERADSIIKDLEHVR
ncbi:MAG: bifunctional riboflavin kinase/FAD synthetase [Candidatus Delongbacteria bacterium]|nr:bifunctional riboflavin kinase/FAD synthetase [Candidatus Delongbacteria bacterium]